MANYLMSAAGRPKEASGAGAADHPGLANSNHYRVKLYRNGPNPIRIEGNTNSQFAFTVNAEWGTPLASVGTLGESLAGAIGGQALQQAVEASGATKNILGSAKTWGGGSEFQLDLPIRIDAVDSTAKELMMPMKDVMKSVLPTVKGMGVLSPPGPNSLEAAAGIFGVGSYSAKEWESKLKQAFQDEAFHVRIGSFFHMFPCVLSTVQASLSSNFEHGTGNPMSIEFTLGIQSYLTATTQDIDNWLKINEAKG